MSFASNTPIHFLPGIGPRTAAVLHRLGIHTAGQFSNIPESVLIELFGPSIRTVTSIVTTHQRQYLPSSDHYEPQHAPQQSRGGYYKKSLIKKLHLTMNLLMML